MAKAQTKAEVQKVEEVVAHEATPQSPEPKQPKVAKTNPVEALKTKMKIIDY